MIKGTRFSKDGQAQTAKAVSNVSSEYLARLLGIMVSTRRGLFAYLQYPTLTSTMQDEGPLTSMGLGSVYSRLQGPNIHGTHLLSGVLG